MNRTARSRTWTGAALGVLLGGMGCVRSNALPPPATPLDVHQAALYPETVLYDPADRVFLVSSMRDGGIFAVDDAGQVSAKVKDSRLCSVLGIAQDRRRGALWALNSDLGVSVRASPGGKGTLAAVGIYDAQSGAVRAYVDLASLLPGPHLLNGIAIDDQTGDAFVTDSFAPAIYRVRADGQAAVFLQSPRFAGAGINLNGVVVHPDGYLLVIKKSDGLLFKVPLAHPEAWSEVRLPARLLGGDGVTLAGKDALVVVANKVPAASTNAAFFLASEDGWDSATVRRAEPLGEVYPTTSVLRDGQVFVLSSHLDELIKAPPAAQPALRREGRLTSIAAPSR
jgi:hypothetical protein